MDDASLIKEKNKLSSIQVIRAIAFILIFISHVEIIDTGPVAVSLFLVISGFCMTYSYLDRPDKLPESSFVKNLKFAWSKVKKLYLLHLVTLGSVAVIVFAGIIVHKDSIQKLFEQLFYFLFNIFLLQSWIPWRDGYFSFNAVAWYLSTSIFSYFMFPWIFKIIQSKNKKRMVILTTSVIVLMVAISIILEICHAFFNCPNLILKYITYIFPIYRLGDFIIGLVAGYFFVSNKRSSSKKTYTCFEIIIILIMITQIYTYCAGWINAAGFKYSLFWLPASVFCIYVFACNIGAVSGFLSKLKPLVWLGNISAEAFLIHHICIKAAEYVSKNKLIVAAIAFPLTLLASFIWRWFYRKLQIRISKNAVK
jgi:peptidoglycan/LPS O-acetylase OafA/YrhL